jgi:hypothetical protein
MRRLRLAVPLITLLTLALPASGVTAPPIAESEPNDSSGAADGLPGGQCFVQGTGAISPIGDQDFWSFPGTAGASVWAYVDPQPSTDPFLETFQPDGTTVIEADDNDGMGNGGGSVVDVPPPAPDASAVAGAPLTSTGTHFVRVTETGNNGIINQYRLFLAVPTTTVPEGAEPNDSDEDAGVITRCPEVRSGQIEADPGVDREWDCYAVDVAAGETLYVAATGPEGLVVSLRNSCGDAPGNRLVNAQITAFGSTPPGIAYSFNVTSAARYHIRIREGDGEIQGPYRLMVATCDLAAGTCPATGQQAPRCAGRTATHLGTSGNDVLVGTAADETFVGLGGNDQITGGGGNDAICAGPGKDTVRGKSGKDRLFGEGQGDVVKGGGGKDTAKGGPGRDRLAGQGGNDNLRGQGGSDRLNGGPGIDRCAQGAGTGREISCER